MPQNNLPEWDLSDLFPSLESPEYKAELENILKAKDDFLKYKDAFLNNDFSPADLLKMIKDYEQLEIRTLHIYAYSHFQYDVDTTNEFVKAEHEKAKKLVTDIATELEFFSQGLKNMPHDVFEEMKKASELSEYKRYLEVLKIYEPYTKSEREEQILTMKSLYGSQAWGQFHTELSSGMDFGTLMVDGKEEKMTPARLGNIITNSQDQNLRCAAYEAGRKPFKENSHLFSFAFNAVVSDFEMDSMQIRGYTSGLHRGTLGEEVTETHVENMRSLLEEKIPVFQDYYKWKKSQLGVEKMHTYDLSAPLSSKRPKLTFDEAKDYVLSCYGNFSEEFRSHASRFFDEKWIDARDSGTKYAGAYSWSMNKHPYILLNFQPSIQQAMTMIHELGHGIHALLSSKGQPFLIRDTSKVIAETASQFSEMLLLDYFETVLDDKDVVKDLFAAHIDDVLYCLGSTLTVTAFEIETHKKSLTEGISKDVLNNLWENLIKNLYGDAVELTEYDRYSWSRIPHIFQSPYYYFTYPMSLAVVLTLYELYLEDKATFVKNYTKFLEAGGSIATPELIESSFGITFGDRAFFERAFRVVERMIEKVKTM
ncbi:MAG: M3 family oligoendopeptidase [Candidatus Gracilibacteria bacterium]